MAEVRNWGDGGSLTETEFSKYWQIGDERIDDYREVESRVMAGEIAVEVTVEMQQQAKEREARYLIALERYEKWLAEMEHRHSPEGRRQAAIEAAAKNPGSIVSSHFPDLEELDRFGPAKSNLLR